METNERTLKKVIKYLGKLKNNDDAIFLKVYFYNENNCVIKFLDKTDETRLHTIRKRDNSIKDNFDSKGYYEKKKSGYEKKQNYRTI